MERIGECIDKLITLDISGRGIIDTLYKATRSVIERPLTLFATEKLIQNVKKDDIVLITTGFIVPPWWVQETDGPMGAASLARAVDIGLEAVPIIVTEQNIKSKKIIKAACRGIGLNTIDLNKLLKNKPKHSTAIIGFTLDESEAPKEARELLNETKPSAIIAIEKAGHNIKGEYHTMRGINITAEHAKIEHIIKAKSDNVLTIGIGDGGNEVGMGNIIETIKEHVPYGSECQCPCRGGIATSSMVDLLVVATVSNWGGYGISACLSKLTEKPFVLHDAEQEELMLKGTISEGALDGITGYVWPSVDSLSLNTHKSIVTILNDIIKI